VRAYYVYLQLYYFALIPRKIYGENRQIFVIVASVETILSYDSAGKCFTCRIITAILFEGS